MIIHFIDANTLYYVYCKYYPTQANNVYNYMYIQRYAINLLLLHTSTSTQLIYLFTI